MTHIVTMVLFLVGILLYSPSSHAAVGVAGILTNPKSLYSQTTLEPIAGGLVLQKHGDKLLVTNCGKTWEPRPQCADGLTLEIGWERYVNTREISTSPYSPDEKGISEAKYDLSVAESAGNAATIESLKKKIAGLRKKKQMIEWISSEDWHLIDARVSPKEFYDYAVNLRYRMKEGWFPIMAHGSAIQINHTFFHGSRSFMKEEENLSMSGKTVLSGLKMLVLGLDDELCQSAEGARLVDLKVNYSDGETKSFQRPTRPGEKYAIPEGPVDSLDFSFYLDRKCPEAIIFAYCAKDCRFFTYF